MDGLASLTDGKDITPGVGGNELNTDLNISMQDMSVEKEEESTTESDEDLTGWKKV